MKICGKLGLAVLLAASLFLYVPLARAATQDEGLPRELAAVTGGDAVAWGFNNYGQCDLPSSAAGFTALSAGAYHCLGLNSDGSITAWGRNESGECDVPSPNTGFVAVSTGAWHSLGLKKDGSIVAWGSNLCGECDVPSPNTGFTAIAAGDEHSMGLKASGSIVAWGRGSEGQCKIPSPNSGFTAIAGGWYHSIGLKSNGSIVAWGDNTHGQCNIPSPNTGFSAIAAGDLHNLGLKADGSIVAWGYNFSGECNVPSPDSGFTAVAAGWGFSLGLKADGRIIAWGDNTHGQCNIPSPDAGFTSFAGGRGGFVVGLRKGSPAKGWGGNGYGQITVPSPNYGFAALAGGEDHVLGLRYDSSLRAWGNNAYGQCRLPSPNSGFTAIAAGEDHSLALKASGELVVWGSDSCGQLEVPSPNGGFTAIAAGSSHSLALRADGTIAAWGDNTYGQCGIPNANDFVAVAAGKHHSLGLRKDGSVVAWGLNDAGQCDVPAPNTGFTAISGGGSHCLALRADGTLAAWGNDDYGQCDVPNGTDFTAVAAGNLHSLALKTDGSVAAWGSNDNGQCQVPMPNTGFAGIAAGGVYSLGLWHNALLSEPANSTWYLPEGAAADGLNTWILVQNPNPGPVAVYLTFMTGSGPVNPLELQGVEIPGYSRATFNAAEFVETYDLSTTVSSFYGTVICERATYGRDMAWATCSLGTTTPSSTWYLAEGATDGGMETWLEVLNPNSSEVKLDIDFISGTGRVEGPRGYIVEAGSRATLRLNDYVTSYDVSTVVASTGGDVVCERATYGGSGQWGQSSMGATEVSPAWYLAEGSTEGGMETWVLVQNPGASDVTVDLTLMASSGARSPEGLQGQTMPAGSRRSFRINDYVTDFEVSTVVESSGGGVVCERAMYGDGRTWATGSVGAAAPSNTWLMAEGCTGGGMETWVLVQNPCADPVVVDLSFMTSNGPVPGPQGVAIPPCARFSFRLNDYVTDYDVSTQVVSREGVVVCERAVYGEGRTWAHDSVGFR